MTLRLAGLLLALFALASAVAPAQEPQAAPAPGCQGAVAADARDDHRGAVGVARTPSTDLTQAFFRTDRTTGGRLVTSANVQVARLEQTTPAGAQSLSWIMHWRHGPIVRFAAATVRAVGEPSFAHGRLQDGQYVAEGGASGRLLPGDNGIAQIVLPESISRPGARMNAPYASSQVVSDFSVAEEVDLAPDDAATGGKSFVVAECDPQGEAPVPEPGPPVPAPESEPLEHAPPNVTLMTRGADAGYVSRRGRIFLRLRSTGPVTALKGTLSRGSREVGSGRLKAMHGKGTLIVRLARRVRPGVHRVVLRGRDAEGAPVRATGRLRLR